MIDTYPWVIKCLKGTPHETFKIKARGGPKGERRGPPKEGGKEK